MSTDSKIYLSFKTASSKQRWLKIMKGKYKLNKITLEWILKEEQDLKDKYEEIR